MNDHPRQAGVGFQPHLERERARHSVFIVGAGRLGMALARGLAATGWQVDTWSRTSRPPRLQGIDHHVGPIPPTLNAELVILTVPDRVIAAMAQLLADSGRVSRGQVAAHCAGALDLAPLAPLKEAGLEVGSLHPLAAATPGMVGLHGHSAALDGSPKALRLLRRLARDSGLRPIAVASSERARYHAAASLAANGLVSLADLATELLVAAGVPPGQALDALVPLLDSAVRGLEERGLPAALTGPIARGDAVVVESHLEVLAESPAFDAYRALGRRALELAREQRGADAPGLERIERLLKRPRRRKPKKS